MCFVPVLLYTVFCESHVTVGEVCQSPLVTNAMWAHCTPLCNHSAVEGQWSSLCGIVGGFFCFVLFCFVLLLVFRDRLSLYSSGCPGIHSVDQAALELRNPPASASQVLGLKACATMPGSFLKLPNHFPCPTVLSLTIRLLIVGLLSWYPVTGECQGRQAWATPHSWGMHKAPESFLWVLLMVR